MSLTFTSRANARRLQQLRGRDGRLQFVSLVQHWDVSEQPGYDLDNHGYGPSIELCRPDGVAFAEFRDNMERYMGDWPTNVLRGSLHRNTIRRSTRVLPLVGDVCRALVVPREVDFVTVLSGGKPVFSAAARDGRVAFEPHEMIPIGLYLGITIEMYTVGGSRHSRGRH